MLRKQRDIFAAFAQRWQVDFNHVQPIIKIFAEFPLLNLVCKIFVSSRNNPNFDFNFLSAAHAIKAAFLQYSQQVGLQFGRDISDFVEEDGATIGQLELPFGLSSSSRESSFFVTEQFAFQQSLSQRCAADGNEWLVRPATGEVNSPRNQFFTRPAFSSNQNRAAQTGDFLG